MARKVKLAPTEKSAPNATQVVAPSRFSSIRKNIPTIVGAVALVAAGALAGGVLARGGFDGRDGRHAGPGMEARMDRHGDHRGDMEGPGGHRDGDEQTGAGGPQMGADLSGTVVSATATQLTITRADGTTQSVALDAESQYFSQTTATAADVTVGSYVLVEVSAPNGTGAAEATGIAVLANGLTDAHVHLGRPAKVTAVNGSELTLESLTPRGVVTTTVTIGAQTAISTIATASVSDLASGSTVVVDLGRDSLAAKSVLIVK